MAEIIALLGITAGALGVLAPAYNIVQKMASTYSSIKFGRKRCKDVIVRAGLMVKEVHGTLQSRTDQTSLEPNVVKLTTKLQEVQTIMQKLADRPFFKALLHFDDVNGELEQANRHLGDCLQLFQIELLMQAHSEHKAAKADRDDLLRLLKKLAGNYEEVRSYFDINSDAQEDEAMAVMSQKLSNTRAASEEDMPVEMRIIQKSLETIKATTGKSAPKQHEWLITEYDLESCGKIGGGGFSTVSKAQFRGMMVAVKTLKDVTNSKEALENEVEIWRRLRHDHIVPFYGASTLAMPPFIVSRYMRNGNLVQYLIRRPNVDRIKLVCEISLGMYYLHEERVVHGDLKGVNVLVDDSGKACITDFGLSKIFSPAIAGDKTRRISGTLRFLAPEALEGQPLTFETDVYAFGMVIYEIFTEEIPFIREPDHMIWENRLELERPMSSRVRERGLDDTLWQLLSDCISRQPSSRPRFKTIQTRVYSMMKTNATVRAVYPAEETDHDLDTETTTFGSQTLTAATTPLLPKQDKFVSREQPRVLSSRSISQNLDAAPPMCIQVTHKHLDVTFGLSSREPGVRLRESNTWQPIKPKKSSLLTEEGKKFTFRSSIGEGNNSWELDGNDAVLRNATVDPGVCHFADAHTAQRWFSLQLSYARDGSVGGWGPTQVTGDWSYTQRTWRRVSRGKLQQAALVDGAPGLMPSSKAWSDVKFPKRLTIDASAGTQNRIVCITNPGKQAGKLCCNLEGNRIILKTFRQQSDREPITESEETYSSKGDAETMFEVLRTVLRPT